MEVSPGTAINCGRKGNYRKGSVLAFFLNSENEVFVASAAHVITGQRPIKTTHLKNAGGESVATYRSGSPKYKIRYVDFLLGSINSKVKWTNRVANTGTKLNGIAAPSVGQEIYLVGRNASYKGVVSEVLEGKRYRHSFVIECIGKRPRGGDSGAPWFTEDGKLIGIHVAAYRRSSVRAHYLTEIMDHYQLVLA